MAGTPGSYRCVRAGLLGVVLVWGFPLLLGAQDDNPFLPKPRTEFELSAYQAIGAETDPNVQLRLGESFLVQYPESELRHLVLRSRWNALVAIGDPAGILGVAEAAMAAEVAFLESRLETIPDAGSRPEYPDTARRLEGVQIAYFQSMVESSNRIGRFRDAVRHGERGLELEAEFWSRTLERFGPEHPQFPSLEAGHGNREYFFLRQLVSASEGANDRSAAVRYARRVLALDANDLGVLITAATLLTDDPSIAGTTQDAAVAEGEGLARRALDRLDALTGLTDAESGGLRGAVYSAMGMVRFRRGEFGPAAEEFERAVGWTPRNPMTQYRLGISRINAGQLSESLTPLALAVHLEFPGADAFDALGRAWEVLNGDLAGLDAFVETTGRRFDNP